MTIHVYYREAICVYTLQFEKRIAAEATKPPFRPLRPFNRVWERISMDIVGSLKERTEENKYFFVLSDYTSRFAMKLDLEDQRAKTWTKQVDKFNKKNYLKTWSSGTFIDISRNLSFSK